MIPMSRMRRIGRLADNPSLPESVSVSVAGTVGRGVAVAPSTWPDDDVGVGDAGGVGVTTELGDGVALAELLGAGLELGGALGVPDGLGLGTGDGLGVALLVGVGVGDELGVGLLVGVGVGDGLGLGDGQDGTVIRWMIEPSEKTIW